MLWKCSTCEASVQSSPKLEDDLSTRGSLSLMLSCAQTLSYMGAYAQQSGDETKLDAVLHPEPLVHGSICSTVWGRD